MIYRYSSSRQKLHKDFLIEKLQNAVSYDRIAGYFCSSILDVAGESIENVQGNIRVICNYDVHPEDVAVARHALKMKEEWCTFKPEEKYITPQSMHRLSTLHRLLKSGKLEVRVMPKQVFGLMHGKAGVITYPDGRKTSFLGSVNETRSAFTRNYEMLWEDDSPESVAWVQEEFDYFWNSKYAKSLCDFVVLDMGRISDRTMVVLEEWKESGEDMLPSALVEEPVCRQEFGLYEYQKYFVDLTFKEHQKDGGARFLLADQVGVGKTVELATSAKLMALYGTKPILIIVPKTLKTQWQKEMKKLLNMPSAIWTGRGWQDENERFYPWEGSQSILQCPRRVGIVSQGLVSRQTEISKLLKQQEYECVIVDEAHRARRRNGGKDANKENAVPNFLLAFLNEITYKTKSFLLATATPVQINTIEVYDLLRAISLPTKKILGDSRSEWNKVPQEMLDMICGKEEIPTKNDSLLRMWDIMRNPFPPKGTPQESITRIRQRLDLEDTNYVLDHQFYENLDKPRQREMDQLYEDDFMLQYNPYIKFIVRRTRAFLENTINPKTGETYLKKITVELYGEGQEEALVLDGYLKQAYEKAQDFCDLLSKRVKGGGFLSTLILKRIGSTIVSGEYTARKLLAWTEEGREFLAEEFDEDEDENVDNEVEDRQSQIKNLTSEEVSCLKLLLDFLKQNKDNDPKYLKLKKILSQGVSDDPTPWKDMGCIIFSQYYDSANFVAEQLSRDFPEEPIAMYAGGDKSGIFTGGMLKKCSKDHIKEMVRERTLKVLVGTDAASEGLNLQTLGTLINLDLPWNPTRLEQRKGRILRIGQVRDTVKLFNMRYSGSVEDKVHQVLSARLENIKDMFGQIPDTLEDLWIDIALHKEEQAEERINNIPTQHPFTMKYEMAIPEMDDYELCTKVLDNEEKLKVLMNPW